jgi:thiol-disulfide isomerase/thioredoxin
VTRLIVPFLVCAAMVSAAGLTPVDEAGFQRMVASHHGEIVLVDFWATWCTGCRAEMPKLIQLAGSEHGKKLQLITVSADDPEQAADAAKFIAQVGAPRPAYIRRAKDDDRFINSVDRKWSGALPALFLYDRDGHKVRSFIGETPPAEIAAAIAKLK